MTLTPKTYPFDYQANKGKRPTSADYDILVTEDTDIKVDGVVVCSYRKLPPEVSATLSACVKKAKCQKSARTLGVVQNSAVFGALPRVAVREDYCRFSAPTKSQPEVFFGLATVAQYLWSVYKDRFPSVALEFEKFSRKIPSDWKKTGTPFTTVNVNKNYAIGYHLDAANYGGVYSNVLISKKHAKGGHFVLPQYRIALAQDDGALVIVDGVKVPHGVTAIEPTSDKWERSSVVFYTLGNLQHCLPKKEELARAKKVTTERARKRAKNIDPRTGV
jgi:hypothetical protein